LLGVVHLHPHAAESNEAMREIELATVLQLFKRHRGDGASHLLVGDFNANSPHQKIDPAKCGRSTRQEWEANGGQIPRRVIQRVLDEGYVDVLHAIFPRKMQTTGTFCTEHPGQRVDYVFTYGIHSSRLGDGGIFQDRASQCASDHFPIWVEIS
jgi:exonuclease III